MTMNNRCYILIISLFIAFSQSTFGENLIITKVKSGETYDFSEQNIHVLGKYRIIEYPKTPRGTIEFQMNKKPLFVKDGGSYSIFHENSNSPVVILDDSDGDGTPDRLIYDIYNKTGKLVASSTDLNLDGQIDLRFDMEAEKQYVWLNDKWNYVKEFGRDQNGKVVQKINVKGKWKRINYQNYPIIIEK